MPIDKHLTLSTAHLIEEDVRIVMLDLQAGPDRRLIGLDWEYGFFLHVCLEPPGSELRELESTVQKKLGLSASFAACVDRARELGCPWIRFDCDAELEEALPVQQLEFAPEGLWRKR
jgi:hypothetical protein